MTPCEKILQSAREHGVDMVGLSGLITPSLEEMARVARELEREGFAVPLLIGGATTSPAHTALRIAPEYGPPVVHVPDASRAVGVVSRLLNPGLRPGFVEQNIADQARLREQHENAGSAKPLLALEEARRRRPAIAWRPEDVARPEFLGVRALDPFPLEELVPYIDWSPFFHAWDIRGRYPALLEDPRARELFDDARRVLDLIVSRRRIQARGVYGFFPANRAGDDVEVYSDDTRGRTVARFHFLRQQMDKPAGQFNHCLADFIAPVQPEPALSPAARLPDYLGAFAVSAGFGVDELCAEFVRDHDDYQAILAKALADRLAEAFAECLHRRVRIEWGYGRQEQLSHEDLIRERYRGIRPAAGYPACPDHTEKWTIWRLLDVERSAGIELTESCAMRPASSVSGLYFAHPEAKYFAVGRIARDQVLDYHRRKQMELAEIERWLAPNLGYTPA